MDDLTATLIIQLQLDDINDLRQRSKGKNLEGSIMDSQVAQCEYQKELERFQTIIHDRRMGHSISQAVESDAEIITRASIEEDNAARDHQLACVLGGINHPAKPARTDFAIIDVADDLVQRLSLLNVTKRKVDFSSKSGTSPESSTSSKSQRGVNGGAIERLQCISCQEEKHTFDIVQTPCGHRYCRDCINHLFEASTTDESLFPPRCCREVIPISGVKDFLCNEFLRRFEAKSVEFSTPNRTYCVRPNCSAFIPPSQVTADIGVCPSCQHSTCTLCKGEIHGGECPSDSSAQALLALASQEGWMRCYSCKRMVELDTGCHHMTYEQTSYSISTLIF